MAKTLYYVFENRPLADFAEITPELLESAKQCVARLIEDYYNDRRRTDRLR